MMDIQSSCWPENKLPSIKCLLHGLGQQIAVKAAYLEEQITLHMQHSSNNGSSSSEVTVSGNGKKTFSYSQQGVTKFVQHAYSNKTLSIFQQPSVFEDGGGSSSATGGATAAPYRTLYGHQPVYIHPSSVLFHTAHTRNLPQYVIYAELLYTSKAYMRNITIVDQTLIEEVLAAAAAASAAAANHSISGSNNGSLDSNGSNKLGEEKLKDLLISGKA